MHARYHRRKVLAGTEIAKPINIITAYYVTICMPAEKDFRKMACQSNSIFLKTDFEKKRSNDFESQLIDMVCWKVNQVFQMIERIVSLISSNAKLNLY